MRYSILVAAVLFALALSACDNRPAPSTPAAVVTVPVPGPAGPQGTTGAPAEKGEPGSTGMTGAEGAKGEQGKAGGDVIVVVPAPAPQR